MTTTEHDSAAQRLDVEHVEQERLRVRYKAAIGAPADHRRLGAADDQVAPREARDDQARDAKDRNVRRTRRRSRAVEAFRKRAEATERRWLTGLRAADKDPNEDKPRR